MKDFVRSQWMKAERSLAAAQAVLGTDPDSSASRAYYAAFYGLTALLAGRGMEFTKHTAVRAALHRDLIQAGLLSADFLGRWVVCGVRLFGWSRLPKSNLPLPDSRQPRSRN